MPVKKAIIEILDKAVVDSSRGIPATIQVAFNPTEYSLDKGAQISEIAIPGLDSPILQFVRGQTEKLSLELFFDTTAQGMGDTAVDVRQETNAIYQLVKIQPKTHAPPRVRFVWGAGLSFKGIVENVQQKFTLFSPNGVPLRATVSVTFKEYKTVEEQIAELNLQSADHTKRRVVTRGETLTQIASEEYNDARSWRHIASLNNIANPRRLTPGTALLIPPLDAFSDPILE
ncbi:MAG: LysM peptidoglycan-binding domain-containing protein [Chloroflexota bacterium]